ncbi:MAG: hypothetical protein RL216_1331 [Pseudomonadota bacterium]
MTTLTAPAPPRTASRLWTDAPAFTALALLITLAMVPVLAAMTLDPRNFGGEDIWLKPLKFHIALVVYLVTLSYFARWMTPDQRGNRLWRGFVAIVCLCVMAELLWIGAAAALGTGSHFNLSSPVWAQLYSLMGIAAVTLTSASLVMGIAIQRNRTTGLAPALKLSIVTGLILTFVLTVLTAGYMASTPGHHVGTPVTGATLPVFGWSREVGDLRVAHFLATHALHGLPLVGWLAARRLPDGAARLTVLAAAAGYTALVLATFAQAIAGQPLI